MNSTMNSCIPISRFDEANIEKVFTEVKEGGCKIIFENNVPAFVLMNYAETLEEPKAKA
jgi:hypothetical protein